MALLLEAESMHKYGSSMQREGLERKLESLESNLILNFIEPDLGCRSSLRRHSTETPFRLDS